MKTESSTKQNGSPSKNGNGNRPVHEIRIGRINAAVWEHTDGENRVWHNVTITRIYKDGEGNWQRSDSFGKADLPLVVRVAERAFDWLYEQRQDD